MTIKEKLEAMKAIEDQNRAVDQAFLLGQQSVESMREFSYEELKLIQKLAVDRKFLTSTKYWKSDFVQSLMRLSDKVEKEIKRRDSF